MLISDWSSDVFSSDLDIMWTVPTITIRFPSNIPNMIGHNVTSAIAMATPIAHKGAVAGAKALAMTVLDLMTTPKLVADAKAYFKDVQLKTDSYDPEIGRASCRERVCQYV